MATPDDRATSITRRNFFALGAGAASVVVSRAAVQSGSEPQSSQNGLRPARPGCFIRDRTRFSVGLGLRGLTCGVPTIEAAKWCHGGAIPERTRCTRWTSSHVEPSECLGGESVEYFFVRFWLRLLISGSEVRVLHGPPFQVLTLHLARHRLKWCHHESVFSGSGRAAPCTIGQVHHLKYG
jgi:hypothetical protein